MSRRILDAVGFIGRFVSDYWAPTVSKRDIREELRTHGFSSREIQEAFVWIEDHTIGESRDETCSFVGHISNRILSPIERTKIDPKAHAILLGLASRGVIDSGLMEEIIEHCLHSDYEEIHAKEIKSIAALCIFNRLQTEWREFLSDKGNLAH